MKTKKFLRIAAICSVIGAVTTLVLVLLQEPGATTFDERVMLHKNALYLSRLWIFFFHPQLNVIAALGITTVLLKKKPELIIPGTLFLLIWGVIEAAQHAFIIDAVNQYCRKGYLSETDETIKSAIFNQLIGAEAISDSMYFLLVYCYGIGSSLLGVALLGSDKLATWIGAVFIFFGIVSLAAFSAYYAGFSIFSKPVNFTFNWIYPVVQPIARFSLGVWTWRQSSLGG